MRQFGNAVVVFQVGVKGLNVAEQADGSTREQKDQHGGQSGF
jgi:hypothetical protein